MRVDEPRVHAAVRDLISGVRRLATDEVCAILKPPRVIIGPGELIMGVQIVTAVGASALIPYGIDVWLQHPDVLTPQRIKEAISMCGPPGTRPLMYAHDRKAANVDGHPQVKFKQSLART